MWCIPPHQNAEFVQHMEDVLEIYSRPLDSRIPVVCMDEQPIQLLADSREPIHLSQDNHTEKVDHEYIRCGTCNSFMFTEPLGGWRHVEITRTRTKSDWAKQIKWLVDEVYGDADNIILVCTTSIHTSSLPCTRTSRQKKHSGCARRSSSIILQSMEVGSTWQRLSCLSSLGNASTGELTQ